MPRPIRLRTEAERLSYIQGWEAGAKAALDYAERRGVRDAREFVTQTREMLDA